MIKYSLEPLYHFICEDGHLWFSIGDPKTIPKFLYCPYCGIKQEVEPISKSTIKSTLILTLKIKLTLNLILCIMCFFKLKINL